LNGFDKRRYYELNLLSMTFHALPTFTFEWANGR